MHIPRFGWLPSLALVVALVPCFAPLAHSQDSATFESLAESAAAARDAGKTADAIRDYQRAVELHGDWEEGWWYLGTLRYDADHFHDAIPPFQRVVRLNPTQGPAWNFLGLCEFETGDYDDSLAHLQKGQELGSGEDAEIARVASYHLALLLNRSGQFKTASTLLASALVGSASQQVKTALGLSLLRVPLLPQEVDPSQDALVAAAGETAAILAQGDSQKTLSSFRSLLHDYSDVPNLHYAYGLALASAGENVAALAELQEEVRLAPDSQEAWQAIGESEQALGNAEKAAEARQRVAALSANRPHRDVRMIERYGHHSATSPAVANIGESDAEWNVAMRAYEEKHYTDAIAALKTFIEGKPNSGTAWAVMGLAEFELKDYKNALLHLERGQELGLGGSAESVQLARYRLASLLLRSNEFDRARNLLASEVATPSLAKQVQFALGMTLLRIPLLPEDVPPSQNELVQAAGEVAVLLQDSRYDAALPKLRDLVKYHPDAPFLHYAYGTALVSLSQYEEAKLEFRREMQISPASELPHIRLAAIQLRVGNAAEALPAAQRAVELAPDSAEAHYILGRSYLALGRENEAVRELENASKMAPGSPEVHFNLAKAYAKSKRPDKEAEERAIFAHLNALAEQQRGLQGDQSYDGPRDAMGLQSPQVEAPAPKQP